MVGGLEKIIYLPFKLTEALGYYKDKGVFNIELVKRSSRTKCGKATLVAGEIQGVGGFYDHTIDLQAKGKNLESMVQIGGVPGKI